MTVLFFLPFLPAVRVNPLQFSEAQKTRAVAKMKLSDITVYES